MAALASPGPIARARSAPVAPAGSRFSLPSGSVTRISRAVIDRSEEHTSELQSRSDLVCRLLLEKKNKVECAASTPGLLAAVARRFPDFRAKVLPPRAEDDALTDEAGYVIEAMQPHLLLLHISGV